MVHDHYILLLLWSKKHLLSSNITFPAVLVYSKGGHHSLDWSTSNDSAWVNSECVMVSDVLPVVYERRWSDTFDDEFTNSFALNWKMSPYWKHCLLVFSHGYVHISQHSGLAHSSSESHLAMGPWIWSCPCSLTLFSSDLSLTCFRQCWWLWSVTVWAGQKVSKETS